MDTLGEMIQSWRDGNLSDVEALFVLAPYLPTSPVTDALIEIVGKMYQEEVAEWPNPDDREVLADMIHGPEDLDDNAFEPNR